MTGRQVKSADVTRMITMFETRNAFDATTATTVATGATTIASSSTTDATTVTKVSTTIRPSILTSKLTTTTSPAASATSITVTTTTTTETAQRYQGAVQALATSTATTSTTKATELTTKATTSPMERCRGAASDASARRRNKFRLSGASVPGGDDRVMTDYGQVDCQVGGQVEGQVSQHLSGVDPERSRFAERSYTTRPSGVPGTTFRGDDPGKHKNESSGIRSASSSSSLVDPYRGEKPPTTPRASPTRPTCLPPPPPPSSTPPTNSTTLPAQCSAIPSLPSSAPPSSSAPPFTYSTVRQAVLNHNPNLVTTSTLIGLHPTNNFNTDYKPSLELSSSPNRHLSGLAMSATTSLPRPDCSPPPPPNYISPLVRPNSSPTSTPPLIRATPPTTKRYRVLHVGKSDPARVLPRYDKKTRKWKNVFSPFVTLDDDATGSDSNASRHLSEDTAESAVDSESEVMNMSLDRRGVQAGAARRTAGEGGRKAMMAAVGRSKTVMTEYGGVGETHVHGRPSLSGSTSLFTLTSRDLPALARLCPPSGATVCPPNPVLKPSTPRSTSADGERRSLLLVRSSAASSGTTYRTTLATRDPPLSAARTSPHSGRSPLLAVRGRRDLSTSSLSLASASSGGGGQSGGGGGSVSTNGSKLKLPKYATCDSGAPCPSASPPSADYYYNLNASAEKIHFRKNNLRALRQKSSGGLSGGPGAGAVEGAEAVGTDTVRMTRAKKCVYCFKSFLAFLFSTVGLSCLLVGYTILGGFIFKGLEEANEDVVKDKVKNKIKDSIEELWNITEDFNVLHQDNWTTEAGRIVEQLSTHIYLFTKREGWDGKFDKETDDWSLPGALLFSITVITTIGYGHITPKTSYGRVVTMLYAIVGIPLTLLTITNLGGFMATAFRFIYKTLSIRCCRCSICCRSKSRYGGGGGGGGGRKTPPGAGVVAQVEGGGLKSKSYVRSASKDSMLDGGRAVTGERGKDVTVDMQQLTQTGLGIIGTGRHQDNTVPIYVSFLLIVSYITLGAIVFSHWLHTPDEQWTFLIGSYFCFITLSTIGFGDYVPGTSLDAENSTAKLLFCALYLIFGLALIAMCFDLMQEEVRRKFRALGRRIGLLK